MLDFQKEILEFCKEKGIPNDFDGMTAMRANWGEDNCCLACYRLFTNYGFNLPPNLHNRMILGKQSFWSKKYVEDLK